MTKTLTISVIIPTNNSACTLEQCLSSLRAQDYPQDKIEILLIDGGSTDSTKEIGAKYNCTFIEWKYKNNPEPRKGVGLLKAKGKLVLYVDSDNILPNNQWLNQMLKPFFDDPMIVGTQTYRYGIKDNFSAYNRYCALLGANDPVAFYLKKNEKISWLYDKWTNTPISKETTDYITINFTNDNLPTLGGNGFLVKRAILLKAQCEPDKFFHIDVILDIVNQGYVRYALVKNEIFHDTASKLSDLINRRRNYFKIHNPKNTNRRYFIFSPHKVTDVIRLFMFIFFTVTLIQPVIFSIRGYLKKPDKAWFLHPLVCWSFLWAYAASTLELDSDFVFKKLKSWF